MQFGRPWTVRKCTGPYNDQTMSVLITTTDGSVTMFFNSPAGNFPLIEHWVGHGVSVHLCETVWAGHQPRGLICCHQRAAQSVGVPEGTPASVDTHGALCTFYENTLWGIYVLAKRHQQMSTIYFLWVVVPDRWTLDTWDERKRTFFNRDSLLWRPNIMGCDFMSSPLGFWKLHQLRMNSAIWGQLWLAQLTLTGSAGAQ